MITKEGREAVGSDPTGKEFPWHPKPVRNLKAGPGDINEVPTILAFCETSDAAKQAAVVEAMTPIAAKYKAEAKAKGDDDPAVAFTIVTESGGIGSRIRSMLKLPSMPPSKHEHPLEKSEGTRWGCDGCGCSGEGKERFRCTKGCDFDFCGECNAKAGTSVAMPQKLMLLDIPDNGGFYEGPEGDVTADALEKLANDYLAKSLERKQLQ